MAEAYYNEHDPYAAAWLRKLISAGHIAPGEVDERSIEDVRPSDLRRFTQCHFFAGVGVWPYALRRVGWPDDRRIWTGSCPCQPFSEAGKRNGFTDERHLWPAFFHLITHERPERVVGEQVASPDGIRWLDLIQTDLEAGDYSPGAVPFPAAGVGAPEKRERTYWVADSNDSERWSDGARRNNSGWAHPGRPQSSGHAQGRGGLHLVADGAGGGRIEERKNGLRYGGRDCAEGWAAGPDIGGAHGGLGQPSSPGSQGEPHGRDDLCGSAWATPERTGGQSLRLAALGEPGHPAGVANDHGEGCGLESERHGRALTGGGVQFGPDVDGRDQLRRRPGPVNGFWGNADWVLCRDPDGPRWRPVEPGSFPLAHGATSRVGRLRAYGNALVAEAAVAFLLAVGD